MALPKYETELSFWESNRRLGVMTKQGEAKGKMRTDSDVSLTGSEQHLILSCCQWP
jgi:hypothetical protein